MAPTLNKDPYCNSLSKVGYDVASSALVAQEIE